MHDKALEQALAWKRGRKIFWNAHGDLFHENVTDAEIDRLLAVCALTPQHTHMILTKRSARMREYMDRKTSEPGAGKVADAIGALGGGPGAQEAYMVSQAEYDCLPNVWLGVSVEDQQRADERIPDLLATPAAVRFISAEPLLGPVDLTRIHETFDDGLGNGKRFDTWGDGPDIAGCPKLDWVIAGGESGPKARPANPQWFRDLRDQCQAASVPFLFKQWGEWVSVSEVEGFEGNPIHTFDDGRNVRRIGKKRAGRTLDGRTHDEFPA
jgi:protein gp37